VSADPSSRCDLSTAANTEEAPGSCRVPVSSSASGSGGLTHAGAACGEPCSSPAAGSSTPWARGFTSADASCRLLRFACDAAGQAPAAAAGAAGVAPPTVSNQAVGSSCDDPRLPSASGPHSWQPGSSFRQPPASPVQRAAASPVSSPCRRLEGPHWSPVPPRTQLQPPLVVRPM
jgi:hypothetical protein